MRSFDEIFEIAAGRKGGAAVIETMLPRPATPVALRQIPDDRWLAGMTRAVFQAGFNWKVVEAKWPGFEAALEGFDVGRCSMLDDEALDRLVSDTRVIRNGMKIRAIRENAVFLRSLAREKGSAAAVFADWPSTDFVGLLHRLGKEASRIGGTTGQYFLRGMGKDSFILSQSVTDRLRAEGVVDGPTGSRKAMAAIQTAFNAWMEQSGRSLTEISRVLAYSVG